MSNAPVKRIVTRCEMVDGTVHDDIRPIIADQFAYSKIRMKHKGWPAPTDDIMLYAAVQTWACLKRENKFAGTWESFQNECAAVEVVDFGEDVDPTQ